MLPLPKIFQKPVLEGSKEFIDACNTIQSSSWYKPNLDIASSEMRQFFQEYELGELKNKFVVQPFLTDRRSSSKKKYYGIYKLIQTIPNEGSSDMTLQYTHVLYVDNSGECTLHEKKRAEAGDFRKSIATITKIGNLNCSGNNNETENTFTM